MPRRKGQAIPGGGKPGEGGVAMFKGVKAQDPAATSPQGMPVFRQVTVYMTTHDPASVANMLNVDELAMAVEAMGAETVQVSDAVAKPTRVKVNHYFAQTAITVKGRCLFPIVGTPAQKKDAMQMMEQSLNESLQTTNWEVLEGKSHEAQQRRRTEQGRRLMAGAGASVWQAQQQHRGRNKKADAVVFPIGLTRSTLEQSPIPETLSLRKPLDGTYVQIKGARQADADFSVAGQTYFGADKLPGSQGFYQTQVGKDKVQEKFRPRTEKAEIKCEALAWAIENATGGRACTEMVEKTVRCAGGVCHEKRVCMKQPCLQARTDPTFDMMPITRLAVQREERITRDRAIEQQREAERASALARSRLKALAAEQQEQEEAERKAQAAAKAALQAAEEEEAAAEAEAAEAAAGAEEEEAEEEEAAAVQPGQEIESMEMEDLPEATEQKPEAFWQLALAMQLEEQAKQEREAAAAVHAGIENEKAAKEVDVETAGTEEQGAEEALANARQQQAAQELLSELQQQLQQAKAKKGRLDSELADVTSRDTAADLERVNKETAYSAMVQQKMQYEQAYEAWAQQNGKAIVVPTGEEKREARSNYDKYVEKQRAASQYREARRGDSSAESTPSVSGAARRAGKRAVALAVAEDGGQDASPKRLQAVKEKEKAVEAQKASKKAGVAHKAAKEQADAAAGLRARAISKYTRSAERTDRFATFRKERSVHAHVCFDDDEWQQVPTRRTKKPQQTAGASTSGTKD